MSEYKLYRSVEELLKKSHEGEHVELRGINLQTCYSHRNTIWGIEDLGEPPFRRDPLFMIAPHEVGEKALHEWESRRPPFLIRGIVGGLPWLIHAHFIEPYDAPKGAVSLAPLDGGELSLSQEEGRLSLAEVVEEK